MAGSNQDQHQSTPDLNEQYCVSCGGVISNEANICPDCGAPQDDGANQMQGSSQTQRGGSQSDGSERAFKTAIDDKKVEGWDVKSREGDRVILVKRGFGTLGSHVLVAVLTAWWTLFLGNAVYAAYKYFMDTDRMVMRKEEFA